MRGRLALLLLLAACGKKNVEPTPEAAAPSATEAARPPLADAGPGPSWSELRARAKAPSAERNPLNDDTKERAKGYEPAMARGRAAMKANDLDAAHAAFQDAARARIRDVPARAAMAHIRVLGKEWDARVELRSLATRTTDPDLLASILFDLGVAEEGKGDTEKARVAFARSNAVRSSKATLARLQGKSACVASVIRPDDRRRGKVVPDVAAAYDRMASLHATRENEIRPFLLTGITPPAPERPPPGEMKPALCIGSCEGEGSWLARFSSEGHVWLDFAVVPGAGKLTVFELEPYEIGGCGVEHQIAFVTGGPLTHVRTRLVEHAGEWFDAKGAPSCDPAKQTCFLGCRPMHWLERDFFLDVDGARIPLFVEQVGSFTGREPTKTTVKVTQEAGAVRLVGGSCDETVKPD